METKNLKSVAKLFPLICMAFFSFDLYAQQKPILFLNGIKDSVLRRSQLSDTSIILTVANQYSVKGIVNCYFHGEGFTTVSVRQIFIGTRLSTMFWKGDFEKFKIGSRITFDGFRYYDEKSKKNIYFEGRSYLVSED